MQFNTQHYSTNYCGIYGWKLKKSDWGENLRTWRRRCPTCSSIVKPVQLVSDITLDKQGSGTLFSSTTNRKSPSRISQTLPTLNCRQIRRALRQPIHPRPLATAAELLITGGEFLRQIWSRSFFPQPLQQPKQRSVEAVQIRGRHVAVIKQRHSGFDGSWDVVAVRVTNLALIVPYDGLCFVWTPVFLSLWLRRRRIPDTWWGIRRRGRVTGRRRCLSFPCPCRKHRTRRIGKRWRREPRGGRWDWFGMRRCWLRRLCCLGSSLRCKREQLLPRSVVMKLIQLFQTAPSKGCLREEAYCVTFVFFFYFSSI